MEAESLQHLCRKTSCISGGTHSEFVVALDKTVVDECDGQCQEYNATDDAHSPKDPSPDGHGVNVSVSDCCHGDDDPPGGGWNAGVILVLGSQVQAMLQQLCQGAVYRHGNAHKHQQHDHLPVASPERQPQSLQTQEMSGQLHEPEHSHHPQHSEYHSSDPEPSTRHPRAGHCHGDIVGGNGNHINDVQWMPDEVPLVSGQQKAHNALCSEPANAHGLHYPTEKRGEKQLNNKQEMTRKPERDMDDVYGKTISRCEEEDGYDI